MTHKSFVFFGTPAVARDTLALLVEAGYVPSLVVTSPDAPKGRGLTLTPSETNVWASERGLPVLTPEKLTASVREEISKYGAEYAIVVAYGKLLTQPLIDSFPQGVLNVHYSLLPAYRGASPVETALLNGETETGVSVQKMVLKLDAGEVLGTEKVAILPTETTKELRARLVIIGARLLVSLLPDFESGSLVGTVQDETLATFSGKLRKEDGRLSLLGDPKQNWNIYRAFAESPGTHFFMSKEDKQLRVKLLSAVFENNVFTPVRVVPEGKKEMAYQDLLHTGWIPN
ncbi:methionyl-tRNA formyltransferase [Patescibacteria group bacterium]|nr:methionyl-tRNA formyltransferase [Patescibacteria group bacterium]MBU1501002.1 methionyl-tRNA formyltransferase [Patescibacteria group bacterium]MBU2080632.1 methionyl-tRNA formyltransferase [Patescibacteria group bacterium]MBU2124293.1 methionyl-tRNA formyltransferase [Patescibacteria group bacterium]MBU2194419.1 methionyl-tRNA formyltransferase [Patescibacteria group bacterium]